MAYLISDGDYKNSDINQVMKENNISMPNTSLAEAREILCCKINRVVVLDLKEKLVGIITYRDFVPAKLPYWNSAADTQVERYKMKPLLTELQIN